MKTRTRTKRVRESSEEVMLLFNSICLIEIDLVRPRAPRARAATQTAFESATSGVQESEYALLAL